MTPSSPALLSPENFIEALSLHHGDLQALALAHHLTLDQLLDLADHPAIHRKLELWDALRARRDRELASSHHAAAADHLRQALTAAADPAAKVRAASALTRAAQSLAPRASHRHASPKPTPQPPRTPPSAPTSSLELKPHTTQPAHLTPHQITHALTDSIFDEPPRRPAKELLAHFHPHCVIANVPDPTNPLTLLQAHNALFSNPARILLDTSTPSPDPLQAIIHADLHHTQAPPTRLTYHFTRASPTHPWLITSITQAGCPQSLP